MAERVHLGTSGYSFKDWVGPFYPPRTPAGRMLETYAQHFASVEVNSTYYALPRLEVMQGMVSRTPERFVFTVKLQKAITHEGSRDLGEFDAFRRLIEPMLEAGKFGGVVAQFPFAFRFAKESRDFLRLLKLGLPELPLFVEFRHASWARPESIELLREIGASFVVVDEPALPGLFPERLWVVGSAAYVRFHGRNAVDWFGGDGSKRYDYLYSDEELAAWAAKIKGLAADARELFVFFNNCHQASAAQNAKKMQGLLELQVPHA